MVNFTQTAAVEWAPSGVRVNAVAPGWIASSGMDHYEGAAKALIPRLKASVPLGRLGTEAECSAAICFLLSEAAAFISGSTLRVDGAAPNATLIWPVQEHDNSHPFDGFHRSKPPEVLR
jgi:citronellol/citronellal dehydrogenase